ncbi:hypothetical protein FPC840_1290004 [Flavobacterium psychrophilum]|nr:hypothetical protein FPC840_1290004 [Flavobacterium psychrophilum]
MPVNLNFKWYYTSFYNYKWFNFIFFLINLNKKNSNPKRVAVRKF